MTLEERVASALRTQTESLVPPRTDLPSIRSAARVQSRRRAAVVLASAVAVALVVVASGITEIGRDRSDGLPGTSPSPKPTTSFPTIDTTSWTTYSSARYDLQVGHPADWTEIPAIRTWKSDVDVANHMSRAQEAFLSPGSEVRVSVWSAPLDPGTSIEATADIEAWVQAYCKASGNTPCTGIHERAVPLCLEARDCHPGLLVPFKDDVQAFFSGGTYDPQAMTVVAVWRGEADSSVTPYGGAQRLLEAFLSTMGVWTASTPFGARR
jgi:hypothetical protein